MSGSRRIELARSDTSIKLPGAVNPLKSLRAKLIASHLFVILLALLFLLVSSAAYLRRYESDVQRDRLKELSSPFALASLLLPAATGRDARPVPRLQLLDARAEELDIRILVFAPDGSVVYDTNEADRLTGQRLPAYSPVVQQLSQRSAETGVDQQQFVDPGGADDPLSGNHVLLTATGRTSGNRVIGVVTSNERSPLVSRYLPRLLFVAALSLVVASLAGLLLSRKISWPVVQLTEAANAMAAGNLEQAVPVEGEDEIGRLVRSFNTMSAQVSAMSRSQRDLISNVAHELRTPLTTVQGYAQALRDGVITNPADRQHALNILRQESERMGRLISQLLDLARLESGQSTAQIEAVNVTALFDRAVERFQPAAGDQGIALVNSADDQSLAIHADPGRMDQILANLLTNALRHTPRGGLVSLSANALLAPGRPDAVELRISDTGEGIPPDRLTGIFDRFSRGIESDGFGLGLAITRELAELQGGTIAIESQPGRGTTVTLTLPSPSSA